MEIRSPGCYRNFFLRCVYKFTIYVSERFGKRVIKGCESERNFCHMPLLPYICIVLSITFFLFTRLFSGPRFHSFSFCLFYSHSGYNHRDSALRMNLRGGWRVVSPTFASWGWQSVWWNVRRVYTTHIYDFYILYRYVLVFNHIK